MLIHMAFLRTRAAKSSALTKFSAQKIGPGAVRVPGITCKLQYNPVTCGNPCSGIVQIGPWDDDSLVGPQGVWFGWLRLNCQHARSEAASSRRAVPVSAGRCDPGSRIGDDAHQRRADLDRRQHCGQGIAVRGVVRWGCDKVSVATLLRRSRGGPLSPIHATSGARRRLATFCSWGARTHLGRCGCI
jgi:hypothetical protein